MGYFDVKIVSANFDDPQAREIDGFERKGGYRMAKRAVTMLPSDILAEVKASNLRGRGGAGFPTGVKWGFGPMGGKNMYLGVNAGGSEPGTFKDRHILWFDPHLLVEGMIIASRCLGVRNAYIYIRGEMQREYRVLQHAVD